MISPYTTGGVGLLGTAPSQDVLEKCDTLLIVGSSYPYIEFLPKPGDCKCVYIDSNEQRIGLRYPTDAGLVGDSKKCLQELPPLLEKNSYRGFLKDAQTDMKKWNEGLEKESTNMATPMKPQVVGWELGKRTQENAIICSDSGTNTTVWAHYEGATKPRSSTRSRKRRRSPDRPDVHRFVNRVAVLSGVKKFPSQFRSPKHIRDALQVVGHCRDADFSSCTR
jgi:thiamine pyrophosphate-dependent acetolactate synthase large subunit-like protein